MIFWWIMSAEGEYLPDTAETLDAFYGAQEDPWKTRTLPEKRVRYRELRKLLPPFRPKHALDLACGEGDFTEFISRRADRVTAYDLSGVAAERARRRAPAASVEARDVRSLSSEALDPFDAVVWLDALNFISHQESGEVLRRLEEGGRGKKKHFLFSSRILPAHRTDMQYRPGYDFPSPDDFLRHVAARFPNARSRPVQLHHDLRPFRSLDPAQKTLWILLKATGKLGLYPWQVAAAQALWGLGPWRALWSPFVIHLAVTAESPSYYDGALAEDVTDRILNRPAAAWIVERLMSSRITPNQITAVSFVQGLAAAGLIAAGGPAAALSGALLLEMSIVVDCVDGQLARAKNMTSEWGDIFDHTSDDFTLAAICGAALWHLRGTWPGPWLALTGALAFLAMLHLTISQYFYSSEYASFVGKGAPEKIRTDRDRVRAMDRERPWGWKTVGSKLLLKYYALRLWAIRAHALAFNRDRARVSLSERDERARRAYHEDQAPVLRLWRFCGVSSVALLFVVLTLFRQMSALLLALAVLGHLYFGLCLWKQRRADARSFTL